MPHQRTNEKTPQADVKSGLKKLHVPEGGLVLSSTFVVAGLATLGIVNLFAPHASNTSSNTSRVSKQHKPASTTHLGTLKSKPAAPSTAKTASVSAPAKAVVAAPAADSSGRRAINFYTGDVRDTMFSEPIPPAPPAAKQVVVKTAPVVVAPEDPWAEWNVTGVATVDDTKIAILENIETHQNEFVRVGETFPRNSDRKIVDIDSDLGVGVQDGNSPKPHYVMMSMLRSYIPLSKSADYMNGNGQGQQGQQGQKQMDMQQMLAAMMQQQAGQTKGQAAPVTFQFPGPGGTPLNNGAGRRQQGNLNRNFNGGGGGGGGRRGGGGG